MVIDEKEQLQREIDDLYSILEDFIPTLVPYIKLKHKSWRLNDEAKLMNYMIKQQRKDFEKFRVDKPTQE